MSIYGAPHICIPSKIGRINENIIIHSGVSTENVLEDEENNIF